MKRKLMYDDSNSVYAAPALESTLLLETGGLDDKNQVGELPSTNISAAVSSGTRTFQYNRYFWNKEMFTFNYTNNAIGVAIAYWSQTLQSYYFAIYPIFLPRIAMTLNQFITTSVTDNPENMDFLIKELVFYLNMAFTSYGVGNNYGIQPKGPVGFTLAPWVTAQDAKGSIYDPNRPGGLIVDNPAFPIFQDGANEPPLLWTYNHNSRQLILQVNPTHFARREYLHDKIAFQIVSLESYMTTPPLVSNPAFGPSGFESPLTYYPANFNNGPESSLGPLRGWCAQGAFATGFGQFQSYEGGPGNSASTATSYSDIYTSVERKSLWADTRFPCLNFSFDLYTDFLALCSRNRLVSNAGHGSGFLSSHFITSLIPARFFTIESDALTRNQKRPISSNSPVIPPGAMAVQFLTLDNLRTWNDNTVAGLTSSAGSILFGSRKSGVDDCSIVAMDPMQSLQTLDLILKDEWGNVIQNYMELNSLSSSQQASILGPNEMFYSLPLLWNPIPPWLAPYDPSSPVTNNESILVNESWWSSAYQFYAFNHVSTTQSLTPQNFTPYCPRSTTFTHFGRVLGY